MLFNVILVCLISTTLAIVCTENICDTVDCKPVENCDGPGKTIKPGFCGCCSQCVTLLGTQKLAKCKIQVQP